MRKHPFFICIIAMMLGSCMHTARDRKLAELITDNMNSGDLVFYNGWAQDVQLQYVQEITMEQRLRLNLAYYKYRQRLVADSVKTRMATMTALQHELKVRTDSLQAYAHDAARADTAQQHIAWLTRQATTMKEDIARMNGLRKQDAKTTDSLQALKIDDKQKFGGYLVGITYNRVKTGVKTPGKTEKLVTADWRCQDIAGRD